MKYYDSPEVNLWRAVVDHAIHDATWSVQKIPANQSGRFEIIGKYSRLKEAVSWIMSRDTKAFNSIENLTQFTDHNLEKIRQFVALSPVEFIRLKEKHAGIKSAKKRGC